MQPVKVKKIEAFATAILISDADDMRDFASEIQADQITETLSSDPNDGSLKTSRFSVTRRKREAHDGVIDLHVTPGEWIIIEPALDGRMTYFVLSNEDYNKRYVRADA